MKPFRPNYSERRRRSEAAVVYAYVGLLAATWVGILVVCVQRLSK